MAVQPTTTTQQQWKEEASIFLSLAIPSALRALAELIPWIVTLAFIGRVGTHELAALSLMETFMYPLIFAGWSGVAMTCNTLVSQAHGVSSIAAMRGWGIMSLVSMILITTVVTGLWVASSPILKSLGFAHDLVDTGYQYAIAAIPNLWLESMAIPAATYISAMQLPTLAFIVQLLGAMLDVGITYMFVFHFQSGLRGAAYGWNAGAGLTCLLYTGVLFWAFGKGREIKYGHVIPDKETLFDTTHDSIQHTQRIPLLLSFNDESSPTSSSSSSSSTLQSTTTTFSHAFQNRQHNASESKSTTSLLSTSPLLLPHATNLEDNTTTGSTDTDDHTANINTNIPAAVAVAAVVEDEVEDIEADAKQDANIPLPFIWTAVGKRLKSKKHWKTFGKQAVPNIFTTALSQWQLQIVSFFAAAFGTVQIAAHNTSICLFEVSLTIAQGLGEAATIRIGHHLGNGDAQAAKRTAILSGFITCLWGIIAAVLGFSLREYTGRIFTDDVDVLAVHESLAPLFWSGYAVLSLGYCFTAILEGQGRATAQFVAFLVGGWIIMLPLASLAWKIEPQMGLQGLWGAMLIGYSVVTAIAGIAVVYYSDWEELAKKAQERQ